MEVNDKTVKILIVDDHPENLLALEAILDEPGQVAVKAHSGREALRCLLNEDFALILLDVELGDMDGFEVAAMIRGRQRSSGVPIIFLTAVSKSETQVFHGYSVGAIDYLFRPFAPEVLRCKVAGFVELYRTTEQARQQAELLLRKNRELDEINQKLNVLYRELETRNRELQTERDFTDTILDRVASLVLVQNPQGQIVRFNRACEEISGYSSEEVRGLCPWKIFEGTEGEKVAIADFSQFLSGTKNIQRESDWVTKDGDHRIIAWSGTAVTRSDGTLEHVISTGVDITDRKQAEKERVRFIQEQAARSEAEASARRTAFLADVSSLLASTIDYQETLAIIPGLASPVLADLSLAWVLEPDNSGARIELSQSEADTTTVWRQLRDYQPDLSRKENPLVRVLTSGRSIVMQEVSESELQALAQNSRHLELLKQLQIKSFIMVPLQSRGRVMGVLALFATQSNRHYRPTDLLVAEDLAHRAALALDNSRLYLESQNANHAKDEFLAMVSHELRTPLNSILGWAGMLRDGKLDSTDIQRGIETIERNAKTQVQLIEDLLDVSRIVVNKLRLSIGTVEMEPVIAAAVDAVRPMAQVKGIQIESSIDRSTGPISGDPVRLQQVIWNLLSNAIKFSPQNGRVEVALRRTQSHIQVRVSDSGKGISSEFLPYVFERFRQAHTGMARAYGGLGLGLAIVRHLVGLHGGTVCAESAGEGKGSAFVVDLPIRAVHLRSAEACSEQATSLRQHQEPQPLQGVSVMVVDDEADARDMISTVIEQHGASAIRAGSAAEAFAKLEICSPAALICDIGMPEMDGLSFIRSLRARPAERGGRTPAMALTAFAMPEDRERSLQAGFELYVAKPVEPVDLVSAVCRLCGKTSVKAQSQS